MVCPNIFSTTYKSSSQSAPRFYASHAMKPPSCQQLPLLLGVVSCLLVFSVQVSAKYSALLSEGVFSYLPTYHMKPPFISEGGACDGWFVDMTLHWYMGMSCKIVHTFSGQEPDAANPSHEIGWAWSVGDH